MKVHRRSLAQCVAVALEDVASSVFALLRLAIARVIDGLRDAGKALEEAVGSVLSWLRR